MKIRLKTLGELISDGFTFSDDGKLGNNIFTISPSKIHLVQEQGLIEVLEEFTDNGYTTYTTEGFIWHSSVVAEAFVDKVDKVDKVDFDTDNVKIYLDKEDGKIHFVLKDSEFENHAIDNSFLDITKHF